MTTYLGEVRIKTKLDAKGISEGMKKVSASLTNAGAIAAQATGRALVGITAFLTAMTLVLSKVMKMDGFKEKFKELNLSLKNLQNAAYSALMPLVDTLMPTLMKIVDWLTRAANAAAAFFALLTGASTYSVYVSGEYADNMERAEQAAKGSVASFDKLNVLNKQEEPGGGGGGGSGSGLPGEWVEKEIDFPWADELKDKLFLIKTIAEAVGVAILAWGISKLFGLDLTKTIGIMLIASGAVMFVKGAFDALKNGVDWNNLALMVGGVVLIFGGLYIVFGATVAMIGLLIGGIALLVIGIIDWIKKGELTTQTFWLIVAAVTAIGFAIFGLPGLIAGVLAVLVLLVVKHWGEIKDWLIKVWEKIKIVWGVVSDWFNTKVIIPTINWFKSLWQKVRSYFVNLWDGIKGIWTNVSGWFNTKVIEPVIGWFRGAWVDISGFFSSLWEDIKGIWETVSTWFNDNVTTPVKNFFSDAWNNITDFSTSTWEDIKGIWETVSTWFAEHVTEPVKELFDEFSQKVKEFMEHPFESLGEFVKGIFNGIIGFLNGLLNGLVSGINNIIEMLNSLHFELPNWKIFGENAGRRFGVNIPYVSGLQIPYLATGAVIPPNAPFAAILGDQSSGRNLEAPEGLIRQIIREELGAMRGFNTEDRMIHNQITIDGQAIYDAVKKVERRVGASMLTRSAA